MPTEVSADITAGHPFWFGLTMAAVLWYTFITGFVAFKGVLDIRNMLADLKRYAEEENEQPTE